MQPCCDCSRSFSTRSNILQYRREVHAKTCEPDLQAARWFKGPTPPRRTTARDEFQQAKSHRLKPGFDDAFIDYSQLLTESVLFTTICNAPMALYTVSVVIHNLRRPVTTTQVIITLTRRDFSQPDATNRTTR